jgi:hypothetical protein
MGGLRILAPARSASAMSSLTRARAIDEARERYASVPTLTRDDVDLVFGWRTHVQDEGTTVGIP